MVMETRNRRRRRASWADLPEDMLGDILRRLPSFADRSRLRAAWRHQPHPPAPWLSVPGYCVSFPDGAIHRVAPLPDDARDARCLGSLGDWLALVPLASPGSLEKGRQVQWDPGIKFILYELWWLSKETKYALRHLLARKFGTHNYTYFSDTAAIVCASTENFIQQRRTIAALLYFLAMQIPKQCCMYMGPRNWNIIFHISLVAKFDCCKCKTFVILTNSRTSNMAKSIGHCFLCMRAWYCLTLVQVQMVVAVHRRKGHG